MRTRHGGVALVILALVPALASAQRIVRAADAWVSPAADGASAFVTIENGTMYEVYLIAAEADIAETVELRQTSNGSSSVVKELPIAAFDRLAMSSAGTHLKLKGLKRPLAAGDAVALTLTLDNGERLRVSAIVK
jgi:copper(I)-binding protein